MNHIFYLKKQRRLSVLFAAIFLAIYGIMCFFGWGKPIVSYIDGIVLYSLTFIFLGDYVNLLKRMHLSKQISFFIVRRIFVTAKENKTKYIYWFKQQAVALTYLTIVWGIFYVIGLKCLGGEEEIVLTADYVLMRLSQAFIFIFVYPFFFRWWDPLRKE